MSNVGIKFGDQLLSILLCDALVILAQNESDLQKLCDIIYSWCMKWRLDINDDKTQMVHEGKPRKHKSSIVWVSGRNSILDYTSTYRYLVMLDEHLNFGRLADDLAESSSRVLGSLHAKFYIINSMGLQTMLRHLHHQRA